MTLSSKTKKQTLTTPQFSDEYWMKKALVLAQRAASKNEVPVGALIINTQSHKLISQAYNLRESLQTPLGHAELLAIHRASQKLQSWRLSGHTLYITLEPCVMCCGAIFQSRLDRVVFGTIDPKGGASSLKVSPHNHHTQFQGCVLEKESKDILKVFFKNLRIKKKETP